MTRDRDGRDFDEVLDERLSALLDGELDDAAAQDLRAELETDSSLASQLEQLRRVDGALRALPEPAVRPELAAQLRERITREERTAPERSRRGSTSAPPPPRRPRPSWRSWPFRACARHPRPRRRPSHERRGPGPRRRRSSRCPRWHRHSSPRPQLRS